MSPWEKESYGYKYHGSTRFNLLTAIPSNLRSAQAARAYRELERKFGKPAGEPEGSRGGRVGSPIPDGGLAKMDDKASHCISSLEAKGLVERRIDPYDARAVQLVLRPQGKKRAVRLVGILDRMQRRFEDGIGAAKLEGMLEQMLAVEELCARLSRALP